MAAVPSIPAGDHSGNLAERRRIQTSIRDASMTMLASASMSHVFWPWALQYAAYRDYQRVNDFKFAPGKDGASVSPGLGAWGGREPGAEA